MSNDDLDTLRPEVREALDNLSYFLTGTHNHDDFYIIRAELLRLADENMRLSGRLCLVCGLHNDSQCPQRNDEMSPCTFDPSPVEAAKAFFARAIKAEAELAALKARIAEAPMAVVQSAPGAIKASFHGYGCFEYTAENLQSKLRGKRVRLVVEE